MCYFPLLFRFLPQTAPSLCKSEDLGKSLAETFPAGLCYLVKAVRTEQARLLLLTQISSDNSGTRTWISNYIYIKQFVISLTYIRAFWGLHQKKTKGAVNYMPQSQLNHVSGFFVNNNRRCLIHIGLAIPYDVIDFVSISSVIDGFLYGYPICSFNNGHHATCVMLS